LSVAITYSNVDDQSPGSDSIVVTDYSREPSQPMQLASMLLDQYLALQSATTSHHLANDQRAAYQAMHRIQQRMDQSHSPWLQKQLAKEKATVAQLVDDLALLSGQAAEAGEPVHRDIYGVWKIERVRGQNQRDLEQGELWAFGPSWALLSEQSAQEKLNWSDKLNSKYTARKLAIGGEDMVAKYQLRGSRLYVDMNNEDLSLRLVRVGDLPDG